MARSSRMATRRSTIALAASTLMSPVAGIVTLPDSDPWSASYAKAAALVSNMTLSEMNNVTLGIALSDDPAAEGGACSGVSGGVHRLGYPGLCFNDAGNGVRSQDGVSAFSSGISVGASWNRQLAHDRGVYMGAEFQRKGVNVALGPFVGPIGRVATGGRNWEGFGADPYLNGILVIPTVEGLEESVISCTKHFVANEQETNRTAPIFGDDSLAVSSNVDDKTMHELYLWPFEDAVNAGTGSIMCAYNRINGTYACENDKTQNDLLKDELGFKGFIVSDWLAQHSGLPSAKGGLDVVMPSSRFWDDDQLASAVKNGTLSRARLEDMAQRTIAAWYKAGQDSPSLPGLGAYQVANRSQPHSYVNVRDPASAPAILQEAIEGHVLVKNTNGALPLKKPQVLSLFGYDAVAQPVNSGWTVAFSSDSSRDLWQLGWAGLDAKQAVAAFNDGQNRPNTSSGYLWTGGGSGSNAPPYISTPFDAIQNRVIEDGTSIFWNFEHTNPEVEGASDACLVFLNAYASEAWDRPSLTDAASDELVLNVASKCANTMVFIHNAGIRLVDAFADHPNVTAIMYAHLPGQDGGRALEKIIYGDVSPSGRLPYTVAKKAGDYGDLLNPCPGSINNTNPQCDFTEGVNIDYRGFLARNVTPLYEFGYGLTYSSFNYSDFSISLQQNATATAGLMDVVGTVSIRVANTGNYTTAEVSQLYLQIPGASTRTLRGFAKTEIAPGATKPVTFELRKKDLSEWDVVKQQWVQPKGTYQISVGKSVLDVQLKGTFSL